MPLNLPPIDGKAVEFASKETTSGEEDEDFNFEDIPFKPEYMYSDKEEIKALIQKGKKVLGEPAASLSWGIDGNRMIPALEYGREGEKQTAKILNALAEEIPEMFVFHSLAWPGSNGDTDHIVVYGNTVIVIDSKRWKATRKYSVTAGGAILRGTVPFPQGKVKIGYALHAWRRKLDNIKVTGIVTIAQEKVFVARDKNWYKAPYRLVESDKLAEFLRGSFAKQKPEPVSAKLLITLGMLLVKTRDRASEFIRVGGELRKNDLK